MTDRADIARIFVTLKTAYPQFVATKDAADLWLRLLKEHEPSILDEAADDYMRTRQFPPTIADIHLRAVEIEREEAGAKSAIRKMAANYGEDFAKGLKSKLHGAPRSEWLLIASAFREEYDKGRSA